MKKFTVLVALALLAATGTSYAVTCAYDNVPAATLLVPYFKVSRNGSTGADIPEGGVVQRPDGSFYVKGPRNVIFGYEEGDPDPNMPAWTGLCVFCGDDDHDVYHCPILDAQENPDAFLMD